MPNTNPNPRTQRGRKPKFDKERLFEQVYELASIGLNQAQIARTMGIHPNTYCKWKKKYTELEEIFREGEEVAIGKVEALRAA